MLCQERKPFELKPETATTVPPNPWGGSLKRTSTLAPSTTVAAPRFIVTNDMFQCCLTANSAQWSKALFFFSALGNGRGRVYSYLLNSAQGEGSCGLCDAPWSLRIVRHKDMGVYSGVTCHVNRHDFSIKIEPLRVAKRHRRGFAAGKGGGGVTGTARVVGRTFALSK